MKRQIILFVWLVSVLPSLFAAEKDSVDYKLQKAISLLNGASGRLDQKNSFQVVSEMANQGSVRAMNALGLCYMEGISTPVDTIKGLYWLKQAANSGFARAWYNLGKICKYGRAGIRPDLKMAFHYMEEAALTGDPEGYYTAGYMLYKGLGCQQNYKKAFQYFNEGAKLSVSPAMYMMGLCYRNGYGVERNEGQANYWLSKSVEMGCSLASEELNIDQPENIGSTTLLRSASVGSTDFVSAPNVFQKVRHFKNVSTVDGTYEGALVTYDWSGQHVIKESVLKINVQSNGTNVTGEWLEEGADTISFKAIWQDSCLVFTEASQGRTDHYHSQPMNMIFTQAKLQFLKSGEGNSLTGNIQMFNNDQMELDRPMYMSLQSKSNINTTDQSGGISPLVYPNPFVEELNITFSLDKESACRVSIYEMGGKKVYEEPLGKLSSGVHRYILPLSIPAASYVLKLKYDSRESSVIVLKK